MKVPTTPPLNGRNLAEFYTSSEARKRTVLRDYARPRDDQEARILMYDPIRRILAEYFRTRNSEVLDRVSRFLQGREFANPHFTETWRKSNRAAITHLREIDLKGSFEDLRSGRSAITAQGLTVRSTADFFATFKPSARNARPRNVAVIVNPSGIRTASIHKRNDWTSIESEVAYRSALVNEERLDAVMYIDLPRQHIAKHIGPKSRIWDEIDATCERIRRDWRDVRLEGAEDEDETA